MFAFYFVQFSQVQGQNTDLFRFKQYTTSDGLPHNVSFEILQTTDGLIWVGTDNGISRFDGFTFRNFGEEEGLQNPYVISLDEASDGTIHLGTYGEAHHILTGDSIIKPKNGSPSTAIQLDILSDGKIILDGGIVGDCELYIKSYPDSNFIKYNFFQDGDSIGYFNSNSFEIEKTLRFKLKQEGQEKIIIPSSKNDGIQIYAYCITKEDQLWLSTNWGVFQFPFPEAINSSLAKLEIPDNDSKEISIKYLPSELPILSNHKFYSIAEDESGNLWFGGKGILAVRPQSGGELKFFKKNLPQSIISRFTVSSSGRIFFATSNTILAAQKADLYCYDLESSNLIHLNDLLSLQSALSFLYIDREDNLWVSTHGGGLYCLFPQKIKNYTIEDKLTNSFINEFIETPDGKIWASTQNGLNIFQDNTWRPYSWLQSQDFKIGGLAVKKNGQLAFSQLNNEKFFTFTHNTPPKQVLDENLNEFWEDDKQFLSEHRLIIQRFEIDAKNKRKFNFGIIKIEILKEMIRTDPGLLSFTNPVCFAFNNDTLWLGVRSHGVFKIFNDSIEHFTKADGLPSNWVNDIQMGPNGNLWVGTKGGVSRFEKGVFHNLSVDDGLLSNWCQTLHFDHRGVLWIGTPRGLHYLQDENIHAINSRQGLVANEINAVFEDSSKRLWVGTTQGISVIDNRLPQTLDSPPEIFLEKVELNGQETSKEQLLSVSSNTQLAIYFSCIAFQNPLDISFQYRFRSDEEWITTKNRSVIAQNLEEGQYYFEVRARKINSKWGLPKGISWEVNPPWWATKRFGLLGGLSLGIVLAFIPFIMLRNRQRKKIEEAQMLNKLSRLELKALQAQMNPHFIFNALNSIMHFILDEDKLQANLYLSMFAKLMRLFLDASKSNYILLDDELEMLQLYIDLELLRFNDRFDFVLKTDPTIKSNSIEIPSMILQPLIENAINHGLANKKGKGTLLLKLSKNKDSEWLTFIVEDNGVGREEAARIRKESLKKYKSHAKNIIESRIQILNATFTEHIDIDTIDLIDNEGHPVGTRVEVNILIRS